MTPYRPALIGVLTVLGAAVSSVPLLQAQAPRPPAQQAGRAVLAGQVVEAGTTRPIAGVLVTLGGTPTATGISVVSFYQAAIPGGFRQTVTNEQGHFLFADLTAATYSIQAEKAGFVPGGYGKNRALGLPQTIALGETDRKVDLRISLSRYATITGRVVDEAGEPLIGVTVLAMRRGFDNGRPQLSTGSAGMSDETDDRGEYRLATLIPGDYLLSIRSTQATMPKSIVDAFRDATTAGTVSEFRTRLRGSGSPNMGSTTGGVAVGNHFFMPGSFGSRVATPPPPGTNGTLFVYPTQFFPSARDPSNATVVTLSSGETRPGVDFQLFPVATTTVSGVVSGPAGPIPNLGLGLVLSSNTSLANNTFFETATTVSDAAGQFMFLGVPAGEYSLWAMKIPVADHQPAAPSAPGAPAARTFRIPDGPTLWASLPISVGRSAVSGLEVSLRTGLRVSGRIIFEGSAARPGPDVLTSAFGARFFARLLPLDERSPSSMMIGDLLRIASDGEGRLSSHEVPPGRYYVEAWSMAGWTFKSATVGGRDVSLRPLDLLSDISTLVITFTDRPPTLAGTVRAANGAGDGSAQVLVFPADAGSPSYIGSMRQFKMARADASGAYRVPELPAGEYLVVAIDDDAAPDFPSFDVVRTLARLATRVTIGNGEQKTQDLTTVTVR